MVADVAADLLYFNPLPRKEGDKSCWKSFTITIDFNPLPRKEGDNQAVSANMQQDDFNPLPRKEGDGSRVSSYAVLASISIHSLVKRETPLLAGAWAAPTDFNPLPRKEGDQKT